MPFDINFGQYLDRSDPHVWCRQLFASLNDGGTWAVPRSGLIFSKRNGKLVLHATMPWMPEMEGTITAEQLVEQQESDFQSIVRHFGEVGITVERTHTAG